MLTVIKLWLGLAQISCRSSRAVFFAIRMRRGYVVISIDAFMFGERRVLLDEDLKFGWDRSKYSLDDVQQLNQKCRAKVSTVAKSLVLAGATWPGVVNFDDRRVVEYLTPRLEHIQVWSSGDCCDWLIV